MSPLRRYSAHVSAARSVCSFTWGPHFTRVEPLAGSYTLICQGGQERSTAAKSARVVGVPDADH